MEGENDPGDQLESRDPRERPVRPAIQDDGQEPRGNALAVTARVPLSEMFGYVGDLRSNTQGRANYTMQFDGYEEVPPNIAEKIVEGRVMRPVLAESTFTGNVFAGLTAAAVVLADCGNLRIERNEVRASHGNPTCRRTRRRSGIADAAGAGTLKAARQEREMIKKLNRGVESQNDGRALRGWNPGGSDGTRTRGLRRDRPAL